MPQSGSFQYDSSIATLWNSRSECEQHTPCCICHGAIISIRRIDGDSTVEDWGWMSSSTLLSDMALYFIKDPIAFSNELPGPLPLRTRKGGRRIERLTSKADSLGITVTRIPRTRPIERLPAQSCGKGYFLLLENEELPRKILTYNTGNGISNEERGPVVSAFKHNEAGDSHPAMFLPVHNSCLALLDRFLDVQNGSDKTIQSIGDAWDCFRSTMRPTARFTENSRFHAFHYILDEQAMRMMVHTDPDWILQSHCTLSHDHKIADSDRELYFEVSSTSSDETIETYACEADRERAKRYNQEDERFSAVCEQLNSDPTFPQDYTEALFSFPMLITDTKDEDIIQSNEFQRRLKALPQELYDRIVESLCPLPSTVPYECNRLLSSSVWKSWLLSGKLIPYIWDLTADQIPENETIDWELLCRMLAQDDLITLEHPLNFLPPGLKNRRRIWHNLACLNPDEITTIDSADHREMLYPTEILEGTNLTSEQFDAEDQVVQEGFDGKDYFSVDLEWVKEDGDIYVGHWDVHWRRVVSSEDSASNHPMQNEP